jgi:hypothetical protein
MTNSSSIMPRLEDETIILSVSSAFKALFEDDLL